MTEAQTIGATLATLAGPLRDPEAAGYALVQRGPDRVWTRAGDFLAEAELSGDLIALTALIKEADLGELAGVLLDWHPYRLSPCEEIVAYRSHLPWPLQPRSFRVRERYGVAEGQVWIRGEDADEAQIQRLPPEAQPAFDLGRLADGAVLGRVHHSAYLLTPLGPGRARLRRHIQIDLGMGWLPANWLQNLLSATFKEDFQKLRRGLEAFPGSVMAGRTVGDAFYEAVRGIG